VHDGDVDKPRRGSLSPSRRRLSQGLLSAVFSLSTISCGPGDLFGPGQESKDLLVELRNDPAAVLTPPGAIMEPTGNSEEIASSGPGVYRRYCSELTFSDLRSFYVPALEAQGWELRPAPEERNIVFFVKNVSGRDAKLTLDDAETLKPCIFEVVIDVVM
jgi:hypothetical protein